MSTSDKPAGRSFIGTRAEGIALVLFTACSWGLTWPQNKYLLSMLPPFTMRTFAGVMASVFGVAVAVARRERMIPPRDQWAKLFLFSMLNFGLFVVLTTQALVWLKASEAVVIVYTLPIWASVLAWPMLGERPNARKLLAILLGLGGVALMVDIGSAEARWEKLPGAAFGFSAAWLFGLGTVLAKRYPMRMPPSASVAWQCALGCLPVLALAVFEHPDWTRVTPLGWVSLSYIATIPMTVAYLAWFRALKLVAASTAATTVLVSPIMGVLGSALLLGEPIGVRQMVALAMTLTGVALAARG